MRRWFGRGQGYRRNRGRLGGPTAAGPGGNCVCPNCGHKVKHIAGQPCYDMKCPKCSASMIRA